MLEKWLGNTVASPDRMVAEYIDDEVWQKFCILTPSGPFETPELP